MARAVAEHASVHNPALLIRTLAATALALGLAASCKAQFTPQEPTGVISEACCKVISKDLQSGAGCRATGKCEEDEKIWMRGAVTCSPYQPEKCAGGRCCTYKRMYGTDDAIYNWDPDATDSLDGAETPSPETAPPAAADAAPTTPDATPSPETTPPAAAAPQAAPPPTAEASAPPV
ncbi:MAG: hypothetical protein KUG77_23355 [Nannocystaceae bacterium]|nr:hypothetical protein [Nannocystaceae bacterium]